MRVVTGYGLLVTGSPCLRPQKGEMIMKKGHLSLIGLLFGCMLVTAAFIVKPTGEISPSVLSAFAGCLVYSGALMGVDLKYTELEEKKDGFSSDS